MKKIFGLPPAAMLLVLCMAIVTPAEAFPPTATTSPGYDRALTESRRAQGAGQPHVAEPRVLRRHHRRHRHDRRY